MGFDLAGAEALARDVVAPAVHPLRHPLEVTARHLAGEPLPPAEAVDGAFEPFPSGGRWGGMWSTTWFRCRARVPEGWEGREVVALVHLGGARTVGFSAEGLVWTPDLRPVQGLHHQHRELPLSPAARRGETVDFYIEAAANPIPRWHGRDRPALEPDYSGPPLYSLEQAELAVLDRRMEALLVDLRTVIELAGAVPQRADEAVRALAAAAAALAAGGRSSPERARAALAPVLAASGGSTGPGAGRHTVVAVGHAHIDTAWLWPVRETRRKCARTFANQLRLLERYPEHRFACSQAVQYQWMKESYPSLYERIRAEVAAGRWEPVGGMWVEADSNVPSGESLVRQLVHGKRFFLDEFGVETTEMWIPDVFGYSAALPQIAAAAGVDALVTQKMSWNDTNDFPHSTFWWEGHDGSRLLAHFPPADTYNGTFSVEELCHDRDRFRDGERSGITLYPFGHGDGGGGPTAAMLEAARRLTDAAGLPAVRIDTVRRFLERLRAEEPDLATWTGELYLEAHRGTLTTHADIKLANRRGEEALRAAELWSVAAGLDPAGTVARLDPLWKSLLLEQFHDILPGSSIAWVYRDAAEAHARVRTGAAEVVEAAQAALAGPPAGGLIAFNPSSHPRREVVEGPDGRLLLVDVPACGWAPVGHQDEGAPPPVEVGDRWMDNGLLRVAWDDLGLITSVWDHAAGREVVAQGARANLLQIHEDHPRAFDAWNVDREYLDSCEDITALEELQILESTASARRGEVRLLRRFGSSSIGQTMRLDAGSRRLEFHTEVQWQERHRFLKVAFPVAVRSARATYEIQHGWIERPTVENTSWDRARFEVCGHRWADLSEPGYGVALLNDSKYGYDIRGHTIRLSLLRGPTYPDPDADRGLHRFSYALLPHSGPPCGAGRVVEEAEAFNLPVTLRPGSATSGQAITVDRPGVSVEALKWADDGDGVVLRICEVHGSRGRVGLRPSWSFRAAWRVDLLERPLPGAAPLPCRPDGALDLQLRPFELVTLRFAAD